MPSWLATFKRPLNPTFSDLERSQPIATVIPFQGRLLIAKYQKGARETPRGGTIAFRFSFFSTRVEASGQEGVDSGLNIRVSFRFRSIMSMGLVR